MYLSLKTYLMICHTFFSELKEASISLNVLRWRVGSFWEFEQRKKSLQTFEMKTLRKGKYKWKTQMTKSF